MVTQPTIQVASLGMADSLILMVLALVVFGPRRLPEIGRQIGKFMFELRRASNDFKFQMEEELRKSEDEERRKKHDAERAEMAERLAALEASTGLKVPMDPPADPQFPTPSPYPEEYMYPTPAVAEPMPEGVTEPELQVQPPSSGEPVAAARPGVATPQDPTETAASEPTEAAHG